MKHFCHECGSPMEADQVFCAECGTSQVEPQQFATPESPIVAPKKKNPWSFKKKLAFTLIGVLAIALVASHYTIQAKTSPDNKVSNFLTALESGDTEAVMKEIVVSKDIVQNEKVYVAYLKSLDYDVLKENINEGTTGIKTDGITRVITDENGHQIFKLKQEKYLSLYPIVSIEAVPVTVKLVTDLPNGEYNIAGKTFDFAKGEQVMGEFLPGTYLTTVSAEGSYTSSIETNQEIVGNEELAIEFKKQQMMVSLSSDKSEAIVFIDGKTTKKSVKDLAEIGPVFVGDTISVHAELKEEKSVPLEAAGGEKIDLSVGKEVVEAKEKEESIYFDEVLINEFISNFRYAYESALNNSLYSEVAIYLQPESKALKEIDDFISNLGSQYYYYDFYRDDVLDYKVEGNTAYVTTYEEFDFTNHEDKITNYKRNKVYEIIADKNNDYKIKNITINETKRSN